MAEEIIYDQVETGGDPDPLGLRRQLKAVKQTKGASDTTGDPLGLRAKLREIKPAAQEPAPQPVFQVQISEPTSRTRQQSRVTQPSTPNVPVNIKKEEIAYIPDITNEKNAELKKMEGRAREAHKQLHNELTANEQQYEKKIRELRRDDYTVERLRSDYKSKGQILSPQDEQRLLQKEKQKQYDLPVTQEDITDIKTGTILDEKNARKFIKDLNNGELTAKSWTIDKYNEIANDPEALERIPKIKAVEKEIKAGRVIYDPETGQAFKPVGIIGSAIEAVKHKNQLYADRDFLKNTENDAAILSEYRARIKDQQDEPAVVPKGKLSEIVGGIAGTPWQIYAAGALGSLGGPQAGMASATIVGGREMAKLEYPATFWRTLDELITQGVPEFEAVHKARQQAEQAAEVGAITGGAMGLVGSKIGLRTLPKVDFSQGFRRAAFNVLKQNGYELGRAGLEGMAVGGIGVAGEVYKNKLAQLAGIKRDIDEGTAKVFELNFLSTVALAGAIKAFKGITSPNARQLMHGLSKMPVEEISGMLSEKVTNGEITQKAADETQQRIDEYRGLDKLIPDDVSEEARFKIQDKIIKRQDLEATLEAIDKAYHPEIKEKIKALDEEIVSLTKEGKQKPEKPESGLTKEQEKEATELAEEWLAEGILPDTAEIAIKKDPIGFFRELAQQAQNRDANWKPFKPEDAALAEQAARDHYGDTVVDYAKELFPAPDVAESGVSVIMPGEIRQPEAITIKPKESAIPEQITNEMNVRQQAGNGDAVGERNAQSEAATREEVPIQEDSSSGQEGIGGPPVSSVEGKGAYVERPDTQLSFRGLQDTANEFGFEDVRSRNPKTDLQTRVDAERTANEWASKGEYQFNVDEMLGKIERREMVPTDEQRLILEQYLANEKQKARDIADKTSEEYNTQLAKVQRLKEIGQIARSEAGAALRMPDAGSRVHPIADEVDAMVAKMEANKVDKLTDQQKAEVEAQVEEYKKRSIEADVRVAELETKIAELDAQKELNKTKSITKRTKKTAEERLAYRRSEIEAARDALRKLRSGESGLSAVPLPGVRELMAIAPHVKNIMVDLVAQGVDNLQDVVKHLHDEFKNVLDGITEKDVHDIIAGEYNEKAKPLTELQQQIRDIQDEAKLINQLESLLNGKEPKAEKAKVERNQKIKDLKDKIRDFRREEVESNRFIGEELDSDAKKLIAIKKRNQKREQEIKAKIAAGEFGKETKTSIFDREDVKKNYPRLRKDALDSIAKKEEAQHEFDLALFQDEMSRRGIVRKGADFLGKVLHTTKAVMSGIDDSATFVQNGLAMMANPKLGAKVWLEHWKDAFSDARFKRELAALHADPDFEIMQKSKLDIVEPHNAASKQVEEAFEKNLLAGKIKISGKDFHPWKYTGGIFERAFTSMGNNMRVALFKRQIAELKAENKTFESHPQEYKDAARVINELTGRGKLPSNLAQASPYITPFIWAPRMLTSTINTLGLGEVMALGGKGYYQNLTPTQRKFALSQLGRGVGMGVAVMGAAALGGAKVDYDPRSVTFGDVIIGDHHYNVFGRYTPVIKALVQYTMGERVKKEGVQDLDSGKRGAKTRMGVVGGFFRGKMTPGAGALYDLSEGRNYFTQKEFGVKDLPKALLTPMSVKELVEGWENDGTWTILNRFLPAFEGLKVSDERDFEKAEDSKPKNNGGKIPRGKPRKNINKKTH